MKTLIIATDFSSTSDNAMNYGLHLAADINASVVLFHVYQLPLVISSQPEMLLSADELKNEAEQKLAKLKNESLSFINKKIMISTEARLGDPIDELDDISTLLKPFAIIMGSTGSTGIEKVFFGSTTLSAINRLKFPVIGVPPEKIYGRGIKKIGYACDFRDVAATTPAGIIKQIVKEFRAELHVLNVARHNKPFVPNEESKLLHAMLDEVKPVYDMIKHENVEDGINEFATRNFLDLVIVVPRKHKLLENIFKTSSTRQLVFHSSVPVMTIH